MPTRFARALEKLLRHLADRGDGDCGRETPLQHLAKAPSNCLQYTQVFSFYEIKDYLDPPYETTLAVEPHRVGSLAAHLAVVLNNVACRSHTPLAPQSTHGALRCVVQSGACRGLLLRLSEASRRCHQEL
jgi:hypothetical protein